MKEVRGLVNLPGFIIDTPGHGNCVIPVKELFCCKLNKDGMIDKLKCCVVFCGNLYSPFDDSDPWNPLTTFKALRVNLAICAYHNIFPSHTDFIQAFMQVMMTERMFIKLPAYWTEHLPSDLAPFKGIPLCLLRAMYGYTYSGKLLYKEQAEFLLQFGFTRFVLPALWFKHLPHNGILIILQYCDDLLCASTSPKALQHFKTMLAKRFSNQWEPRAHWYLQARIDSDSHGNITLDQTQYASAIVRRYLPNSDPTPSAQDLITYESPFPRDFKWSKSDSSSDHDAVRALDLRYQF